jgi:hypothetical protein
MQRHHWDSWQRTKQLERRTLDPGPLDYSGKTLTNMSAQLKLNAF